MTPREWTTLGFRLLGILMLVNGLAALPWSLASLQTPWAEHSLGVTWTQFFFVLIAIFAPTLIGLAMLARTDWFVDKAFASVLARYDDADAEAPHTGAPGADARHTDAPDLGTPGAVAEAQADLDMQSLAGGPAAEAPDAEAGDDAAWVLDFPSLERDDVLAIAFSIAGVVILASAIPDAVLIVADFFRESRSDLTGMFNIFSGDQPQPLLFVAARLAIGLWLFLRSYRIVALWSRAQQRRTRTRVTDPA